MVDDNDDSTLAAAKRDQLFASPTYGQIASVNKYTKEKLDELFPKLNTAIEAAFNAGAITVGEAGELQAFVSDISLSIYPPVYVVGLHEGQDWHICYDCSVNSHDTCRLTYWCTIDDVEVPCICLQQDHTVVTA